MTHTSCMHVQKQMRDVFCRFVRTAEDDSNDSWEVRMARRYYAKLFKEYAVADLSRYRVRHQCSMLYLQESVAAEPDASMLEQLCSIHGSTIGSKGVHG